MSLATSSDDEEGCGAMVIREGEYGETGPVLVADAPVLARLLFLLRSSTSDGERERFLFCSISGMVRQFSDIFWYFFYGFAGWPGEYGCDSGGHGFGRECKGDARTKERANENLYKHTFAMMTAQDKE